jgi:hypothetical protein
MKLEELTQEKLDEILDSVNAVTESNKGLKADLAKAKAKAKGADIDPDEYANLQTQVSELTEKLGKSEKAYKSDTEKLTKSLTEKDGALTKYLLDANLTDTLAKARVKPELMDAAKALLKMQATIKADNGEYSALIGDKPIADFVKEWTSSDAGKHFVAADNNNGGGANGSGNATGNNKTMKMTEFQALSQDARMAFIKDGGKAVD